MYRSISGDDYQKVFVVGDIHGCHRLLLDALSARKFNRQTDLLISVGDLIDRGPDSMACLALLDEPWFTAVCGNHERMARAALSEDNHWLWERNGGTWYAALNPADKSLAAQRIARTSSLPLVIDVHIGSRRYVIAHADYPANDYAFGKAVDEDALIWGRTRITRALAGAGSPIVGAYLFIFGHTPLHKPLIFFNQLYIDTGAVFGGLLTLIELR
ncbi:MULTISPECIES: metallophosphoesterase [unclassified Brenneria]|uniref:metallophosphoesterase n=1 Tax=unclassified Brenneria TaxID=2634434 RepID=UPI001552DF0F|nr:MULTISPECIES: metallophosphoesterase [unclassified Brenneria]MBJ7222708.1 metallophosphoesterase [Brenneria sp. L3-3C-1]MEE3643951.1 metallophosphoesterase [Brenneria sp. L3_3C_1]MEE3651096.1 metallophosphoesterase [Brenneria sp. HEZEL_4_2_4]NPD01051.1 serine/threonine-protein phosphatase [Brenneria sp. hezel4-2-4]